MSATRAFVGLGSNLDDPARQIEDALVALDALPQTRVAEVSGFWRTPPWGQADQPDFVNAVACLECGLDPRELMAGLLRIERAQGRQREGARWGPRIIDLDLLLFADHCIDEAGLVVPHPRMAERVFVLVPLLELDPRIVIPGRGAAADLLAAVDASERDTCILERGPRDAVR